MHSAQHVALLAHYLAASSPATTSPSPTSSSGGSGGGFNPSLLIFILLIVGLFWFMSRGQRKQRQRMTDLQSRLTPGQEVMTGSGIYGRIVDTVDDRVRVEVSPGVVMTLAKQAIVRTVEAPAPFAETGSSPESGDSREPTSVD